MNYTLTALPAGAGTYRIPAFTLAGVAVPMTTIVLMDGNRWVPFIDGENLRDDFASVCERTAFHRCIAAYLQRHDRNPPLRVVIID